MNWDKIRKEFFEQCTDDIQGIRKVNLSPHNLFNWFKDKLTVKTRSNAQNRALHMYFAQLAEQLNNAGYTFKNSLDMEIPFTMELIKETIWKPTQKELFNIKSTTQLTTEMINKLIDVFSLEFGKRGIYVEFPNWQIFLNKLDRNYL